MRTAERDALVDRYFELVDAEAYDRLGEVLADDVQFFATGDELDGLPAVVEWYETRLDVDDPTHEVTRRIHDESASVCEGWLTGHVPGQGPLEGGFVDVFEFDAETTEIVQYAIYTRF